MGNFFRGSIRKSYVVQAVILLLFLGPQSNEWKAPNDADKLVNPYQVNTEILGKGEKIYKQLCSVCHGNKGKGDGVAGSALNPAPSNFSKERVQSQSDGAIFWKLTNGKTPMAGYKDILTEEQRWQLVTYIRELGKVKKK